MLTWLLFPQNPSQAKKFQGFALLTWHGNEGVIGHSANGNFHAEVAKNALNLGPNVGLTRWGVLGDCSCSTSAPLYFEFFLSSKQHLDQTWEMLL